MKVNKKMISKIATGLLAIAAMIFLAPVDASAATVTVSNNAKIKVLNTKLKKLKNGAGSYQTIKSLLTKLVKLNPKKAANYYKTALKKLSPANAKANATKLMNLVIKTVKKSGLPKGDIAKIIQSVKKEERKYVPPAPTPTPYVASTLSRTYTFSV